MFCLRVQRVMKSVSHWREPIRRNRWELNFDCSTGSDLLDAVVPNANNNNSYVGDGWESVPPFGGELIYAGAERLGPRKLYLSSDALARRKEFGPRAEQAWNISE